MHSDRPLIGSVVSLAAGLGLLFGYCHGNVGLSAASPVANSSFQVSTTTTGLPALGGFALTLIGILLLLWAFVAAVIAQFRFRRTIEAVKTPSLPNE